MSPATCRRLHVELYKSPVSATCSRLHVDSVDEPLAMVKEFVEGDMT